MRKFLLLGLLVAANAVALPIITVTPTFGPDLGFSLQPPSSSYDPWATNAMTALQAGQTSAGSGVTGYTAIANGATIVGNEFISTPFTSWKGVACPACAYDTEYGTAMYFSVSISTLTSAETFTLNQLSVAETYLGQSAGFGYPAGFLTNFSGLVIGKDANGNVYSSAQANPNNIALKQLWYVGVGFVQGLDPNATGTNQEQIDATLNAIKNLSDRTTQVCYSLPVVSGGFHPSTGCASVFVPGDGIPEPGAMFLLGGGLAALALLRRRSA